MSNFSEKYQSDELFFSVAMALGIALFIGAWINASTGTFLFIGFLAGAVMALVYLAGTVFGSPGSLKLTEIGIMVLIFTVIFFLSSCWVTPVGGKLVVLESPNRTRVMGDGAVTFTVPFRSEATYMDEFTTLDVTIRSSNEEARIVKIAELDLQLIAGPRKMVQLAEKYDGVGGWKNEVQQTFEQMATQKKITGESKDHIQLTNEQTEKFRQLGYEPDDTIKRTVKSYKEK